VRPWRVIAVWVAAVAVVVPLSPGLGAVTNEDQTSFLPDTYESVQADRLAERTFPEQSGSSALLVVERADRQPLTQQDQRAVGALAERLREARIERVRAVRTGSASLAPDGRVQLVQIALRGLAVDDPVAEAVEEIRERAQTVLRDGRLTAGLTGDAAILRDSREAYRSAEGIVGIATVVLILALMGAIYRSPVAALLPIVTIALVFAMATSLVALAADAFGFEVGSEVTSLLIVVLFGIGTDYLLFFLFRFRERLRAGARADHAVSFALGRVGPAIASAALVVMAAFLALLLSRFESFAALAPALVISVAVMLLASLTLVPSVVRLLGTRVFWPSESWRHAPRETVAKRVGQTIAAHPIATGLASGGLLLVLAVGVLFYSADYDTVGQLPSDTESARAFERLQGSFPAGALNPTQVYVLGGQQRPQRLRRLGRDLSAIEGVASVATPALAPSGDVARLQVSLAASPFANEALDLVEHELRDTAHRFAGARRVLVGGQTSAFVDVRSAINRDFRVVYPAAGAIIAVILALVLRSLIAPIYLLAAVVLGFAATLGATVALFQGIGGEPGLSFALPLIVYLFVVAIGTDYNILMTTRLREEFREGLAPRAAADMAVEHAGPTVAAAGVILAGTFASLILTGIGQLAEMGFAVSVGIVLSAFVMATVFVPSVSALVGRRIWWPGHQGDARPRHGRRHTAPALDAGTRTVTEARPATRHTSAARPVRRSERRRGTDSAD
jgi:putative drug exporter of the RND superfamily